MAKRGRNTPGRRIFSDDEWQTISTSLGLSEREFAIVQAMFDDEHEKEIAEELGISQNTTHTHLKRLYKKTDVTSRVELIIRIVEEYLDQLRN